MIDFDGIIDLEKMFNCGRLVEKSVTSPGFIKKVE